MNIYRHGDVLMKQITKLPDGVVAKDLSVKGEFILAYGEITGHKHVLKTAEDALSFYEFEGKTYLHVQKGAEVTHEEHKKISIEPGFYVVETEREYDYFKETKRQVLD